MLLEDENQRLIRVLFIHGYESGPRGHKFKSLQAAGYLVSSADMRPVLRKFTPQRCGLSIALLTVAALCIVGHQFYLRGTLLLPLNLLILLLYAVLLRTLLFNILTSLVDRCTALQAAAVRRFRPDILVGSSFGGLVALSLIQQRAFEGPALLVAPSVVGRASLNWTRQFLVQMPSGYRGRCRILHGDADDDVPIRSSREFVREYPQVELIEIPNGDHRLHDYTPKLPGHINQLVVENHKLHQQSTL